MYVKAIYQTWVGSRYQSWLLRGRKVKWEDKHNFLLLVKQGVPRQWPLKLSDLTQGETVKVVVGLEVISLGQWGLLFGVGSITSWHWGWARGRQFPQRTSEKWEMDALKQPVNVCYLLPFFSFSFFLTFFPSLSYSKFCVKGYKHENIFPVLEALQGREWQMRSIIIATDKC